MNSEEIRIGLTTFYRNMDGEWYGVEFKKEPIYNGLEDLINENNV